MKAGKTLTEDERAALGEPPGKRALEDEQRRAGGDLAKLQADLDEVESFRMPLMEHLVELKDRMLRMVAAVVVGSAVGFYFAKEIFDFLAAPFNRALARVEGVSGGLALVGSPFEGIYVWLKTGLVAGVMIALPIISYQTWQFIAPGLYKTERRLVLPLSVSSTLLFFGGAAFCYFAIFEHAFEFFFQVLQVDINMSVDGYLSAVMRMMLAFGVCFQLPVVAFFFARAGFIDHKDMASGFRYAVVVMFVLAALITPPDPLTQTLLAIPMILLYGVGMVIAWAATTKVREEEPEKPGSPTSDS